ncbi:hypothetical protein CVT26_016208 [Gymnopilus dilepis]|uniref:Uncharacterized protein n=1 Tax=Gymnopilus dilepis TaxID=231916 RepID=A0A409XYZ5_9AGAR|nr:hypothetical protein CVT26_016208 [Gymnopilus dilepis]
MADHIAIDIAIQNNSAASLRLDLDLRNGLKSQLLCAVRIENTVDPGSHMRRRGGDVSLVHMPSRLCQQAYQHHPFVPQLTALACDPLDLLTPSRIFKS